jgi:hypothetical protein
MPAERRRLPVSHIITGIASPLSVALLIGLGHTIIDTHDNVTALTFQLAEENRRLDDHDRQLAEIHHALESRGAL